MLILPALVLSIPELDWWDHKPSRIPGIRELMKIADNIKQWMAKEFGINTRSLPYRVENVGILLKDAAVLAGLGNIGMNTLVITPEFGPRVRLKAMFLNEVFPPSGPIDFNPCETCNVICTQTCPKRAFENNSYSRSACDEQMTQVQENQLVLEGLEENGLPRVYRKYCRVCEIACTVPR